MSHVDVTHMLCQYFFDRPLFVLPETTFHSVCVLSVLMCTPAETQQTYLDTFFFAEDDRCTAHLDRQRQFYLKPCCVGPNVPYLMCH